MAMGYRTQTARLQDGATAIEALRKPDPESLEELEALSKVVWAGALAMQSLDDLGSREANAQAWDDMNKLQERGITLDQKIQALKGSK